MRVLIGLTLLTAAVARDDITWRTDLEAARKEAKRTGAPMLVVFR